MPNQDQDIDKEMNPPKLKFGMSPKAIEELRQREKKRRRKLAKGWKPINH